MTIQDAAWQGNDNAVVVYCELDCRYHKHCAYDGPTDCPQDRQMIDFVGNYKAYPLSNVLLESKLGIFRSLLIAIGATLTIAVISWLIMGW